MRKIVRDHQVFLDVRLVEEARRLKSAAETHPRAVMGGHRADILAAEFDFSAVHLVNSRDKIQHCRLSCAIRPNQTMNLSLHQRKVHMVGNHNAAKALVNVGKL